MKIPLILYALILKEEREIKKSASKETKSKK